MAAAIATKADNYLGVYLAHMKDFVIGMLFMSLPTLAQDRAPEPVEGVNVLAVTLADSGAVALERVARVLVMRGYRVEARNPAALRLETEPLLTENLQCLVSIQVIIMGHTALLSGEGLCALYHLRPKELYYSAHSQVLAGNYDCFAWGWTELDGLAFALSGKKIAYFHHP